MDPMDRWESLSQGLSHSARELGYLTDGLTEAELQTNMDRLSQLDRQARTLLDELTDVIEGRQDKP
jgi:hypothetical protein